MSAPVRSGASSEPYITLVTGIISTEHNINIKHILHKFINNVQVLFRCYYYILEITDNMEMFCPQ